MSQILLLAAGLIENLLEFPQALELQMIIARHLCLNLRKLGMIISRMS